MPFYSLVLRLKKKNSVLHFLFIFREAKSLSFFFFFHVINSSSPVPAKPLFCNRDFPLGLFSLKQGLCQEPYNCKGDTPTPPAGHLSLTTPPVPTTAPRGGHCLCKPNLVSQGEAGEWLQSSLSQWSGLFWYRTNYVEVSYAYRIIRSMCMWLLLECFCFYCYLLYKVNCSTTIRFHHMFWGTDWEQ